MPRKAAVPEGTLVHRVYRGEVAANAQPHARGNPLQFMTPA